MNVSVEQTRCLAVEVALTCSLLPIIVLTVVGNVMVILAVTRSWELRSHVSNFFIVNLAITDLGCAVTVMPFSLVSVWYNEWIFSSVWCKSVCFFNYLFIITSMLTLALISVDRYIFVVYPLRYDVMVTFGRAVGLIVAAWAGGFLFAVIPPGIGWVWYDNSEIICTIDWETTPTEPVKGYTVCAFIICFGIPMLVMVYCYWGIYRVAKRHAARITPKCLGSIDSSSATDPPVKQTHSRHAPSPRQLVNSAETHQPSRQIILTKSQVYTPPVSSSSADRRFSSERSSSSRHKSNSKAVKSILIIISVYLFCNLPFSLTKLIKVILMDNSAVPFYVNTVASWMAFLSPSCNPIIYSVVREDFQVAFRKILPIPRMCRGGCGCRNEPAQFDPSLVATGRARAISDTYSP